MKRAAGTESFVLNQTMLRVREPNASVAFYRDVLGMTLLHRVDFSDLHFSLYFLGYLAEGEVPPQDPAELARFVFGRETTLELTHNWGTESNPHFQGYHSGNQEPRGFGHIGISVPDVTVAFERFEALGVRIHKRPQDGAMKGIGFILDPDGYWIEIFSPTGMVDLLATV